MYNTIDCFERTKNMNLLSLSPAEAEIMELLWEGGEKNKPRAAVLPEYRRTRLEASDS